MILHPLLIVVVIGDLVSLSLWLGAAKTAFQIVAKRAPQSVKGDQIQRDRGGKTARLMAKFSLAIFSLSTALFIFGITNVLPASVSGAMCASGVLQGTDGLGGQAFMYRFFVFFIMTLWLTYEKLNLSRLNAPLTVYNSRIVLLVLPFFLLAVITTYRGILRIGSHQQVDCCEIVYDQFSNLAAARQIAGIPETFWVWTFWVLTASMILCAAWSLKAKRPNQAKATGTLALLALAWVPIAAITLVQVYTANFYQVLLHHCPWCLFLPEQKFVGVPLFGALVIITLEGSIAYLAVKTGINYPALLSAAKRRSRLAGLRLLIAVVAYTGIVGLPAIYWRLHYGGWIG